MSDKFLEIAKGLKAKREASASIEMPIKTESKYSASVLKSNDIYDVSELILTVPRDLLLTLLFPVFAIDKKDKDGYEYSFKDKYGRFHSVKVIADAKYGRATMYDKEYLLYAIGIIQDMLDKNIITRTAENRPLLIDVTQMLRDIERVELDNKYVISERKDLFNKILQAGHRLMSTRVEMYSEGANKARSVELTMFVQSFKLVQDANKKIMLKIELQNWLWKSVMAHKPADILSLGNDYWSLTPFQRRIYEIFRLKMGLETHKKNTAHECESFGYVELRKLCGIRSDRNFVSYLKKALGCVEHDNSESEGNVKKTRKKLPKTYAQFGRWVVAFNPDKIIVMTKDALKIPKNKTSK